MNITTPLAPTQRYLLIAALILLGFSYLIMLFFRGFFDPDEGRYAEVPREMVVTGHWGEMRMLGYRYYEKPPLSYWMVAPAIAAFGARDWAARIPLLINIVLIAGLFHFLIRRFWPDAPGQMALLVMLSMVGFIVGLCLLLTDGFLVFWFSLTCAALFWAFLPNRTPIQQLSFLLLAAIAAVLGVLTKGAVAVILPAGILLIWLFWERRLRDLLTWGVPLAGLVFLALLIPLMLAVEQHNPGFTRSFIFEEHLARFLGTREKQLHPEPFWFYALVLLPLLLPWTLFLFRAGRTLIVHRPITTDPLTRFCLVWVAVVLVFFSAGMGKLMSYILPAIPPLGLLLGRWGIAAPTDGTRWDRRLWNLGTAGLMFTALTVILVWLAAYFQIMPALLPAVPGISALALIPIGSAWMSMLALRGFGHFPGLLFFCSSVLFGATLLLSPLAGKDLNVLLHLNSSHVFKQFAGILRPEDRVVVMWDYRPALGFYTQRLPYLFQNKNELETGISLERQRKGYLHFPEDLRRMIQSAPGRVYAVIEPPDYETKFLPLKLNFALVDLPRDRDTLIIELLSEK
ncbi:MAG: phospholipid carrier-dependent glycosyltransferase [Verrucomicrobia bacterium]|nr:phospholipid carrier-dependent glycosyltransferase [Verrucomicrobiota bacterium]MBU4292367.1 phospholipid carrier-dependent glycosyltransferase [Verrucomicrobiota bacterium]MBU4427726.1 phospholipid carrier-dependent glycosyltransferase [Verrucomicrobiota bacterium]MCG2680890.1 phospholipid carrier-dependent glycosyltransferase [Kiritimatiellia bacterium]